MVQLIRLLGWDVCCSRAGGASCNWKGSLSMVDRRIDAATHTREIWAKFGCIRWDSMKAE